jgi:erythromycin esterase-like protein
MWRNAVVLDFVGWLRDHNDRVGGDQRAKTGFYGLDLYSLHRSIREVIAYLERVDPAAAAHARERYACFDHASGDDGQAYGFAAAFGAGESCQREAVEQLADLQRHALDYARRDGLMAEDEYFYAEQNARTVKAAEEYYRSMFGGRVSSWNLRDGHMVDTLEALAVHLSRQHRGRPAKIVVWAHNSYVGDARATEASGRGELTVGQLVRERHPGHCRLVGFTTYTGTVTAADDWGGPAERKRVRPALPERSCSTRWGRRRSWWDSGPRPTPPRRCARPGWSGRSASSTARRPSGRAITSEPGWPISSTPSSTSTRRGRSSRWSGPRAGRRARSPTPTRSPCELRGLAVRGASVG